MPSTTNVSWPTRRRGAGRDRCYRSWVPEHFIMVARDPEINGLADHLKGHAIVQVNPGLPDASGPSNRLDLQGGVAGLPCYL